MATKQLSNKPEYKKTVRAAKVFAEMLSGDFGYDNTECNRLALQSMVAGWIMGRPHFGLWMAQQLRKYPRTAIIDEVQDVALQATYDAVGDGYSGNPRFRDVALNQRRKFRHGR